jgi:hypothetical protein
MRLHESKKKAAPCTADCVCVHASRPLFDGIADCLLKLLLTKHAPASFTVHCTQRIQQVVSALHTSQQRRLQRGTADELTVPCRSVPFF